MGIIGWIIFGALAGWVAAGLAGTKDQMGCVSNILVGIAGAFIGGAIAKLISGESWNFDFNLSSFAVAVLGSVVLLGALRFVSNR